MRDNSALAWFILSVAVVLVVGGGDIVVGVVVVGGDVVVVFVLWWWLVVMLLNIFYFHPGEIGLDEVMLLLLPIITRDQCMYYVLGY